MQNHLVNTGHESQQERSSAQFVFLVDEISALLHEKSDDFLVAAHCSLMQCRPAPVIAHFPVSFEFFNENLEEITVTPGHRDMERRLLRLSCRGVELGSALEQQGCNVLQTSGDDDENCDLSPPSSKFIPGTRPVKRSHHVDVSEVYWITLRDESLQIICIIICYSFEDFARTKLCRVFFLNPNTRELYP